MTRQDRVSSLCIEDLSISFGGLRAVDGVSFTVNSGELVSLIGPNGAGKTTLFNMITGFLRPSRGCVFLYNSDVTNLPPHTIARRGMVRTFQITSVFDGLTVGENVSFAHYLACKDRPIANLFLPQRRASSISTQNAAATDLLTLVGLSDRENVPATQLSYGELRLLEIAIALAAGPSLLLLDEPAAGLNDLESIKLRKLLRGLVARKGMGILLVEHDMSVVMDISDRIVVVNFGKKLVEGPPQVILQDPNVREAYLGDIKKLTARGSFE